MALKDCIRKIGKPLRKQHRELLKQYLDEGLTDNEAVDKLLVQINQEILDIADRAQKQGAVVAKRPGVLAEIRSIRGKQIDSLTREKTILQAQSADIEITLQDIRFIKETIAKDYLNDGLGFINANDRELVRERLNKMFFINADLFREGRLAGGLLRGKTPLELQNSWDAMLETQKAVTEEWNELIVKEAAMLDRIEELTGNRDGNTFFQEKPAFYSGVEVAVSTMPMNKGNAENIWTWLIKQPGVVVETRDVIQRDKDGKILRDADKNPITKSETTYPELEFLGVKEYLDAMGMVTKEQLQAFVKERGIKVEVLQYGEIAKTPDASLQYDEVGYDKIPEAIRPDRNIYGESVDGEFTFYEILERNTGEVYYGVLDTSVLSNLKSRDIGWAENNLTAAIAPDGTVLEVLDSERFGFHSIDTAIANYHDDKHKIDTPFDGEAIYPGYQLGGGRKNYRNLIMKLPESSSDEWNSSIRYDFIAEFRLLPDEDQIRINTIYAQMGLSDNDANFHRGYQVAMDIGEAKLEHYEGLEDTAVYPLIKKLIEAETRSPTIPENYTGGHFRGLKNVFAHIRINDRIGPNGERILFVEEIQSDLHQQGKRKGYRPITNTRVTEIAANRAERKAKIAYDKYLKLTGRKLLPLMKEMRRISGQNLHGISYDMNQMVKNSADWRADWVEMIQASGLVVADYITPEIALAADQVNETQKAAVQANDAKEARTGFGKTPNLPFKNRQWLRLATKMILREAAENGYDMVQWTTGDQQNERYSLEKHVESIGISTSDISPVNFAAKPGEISNISLLSEFDDATQHVSLKMKVGSPLNLIIDQDGMILWGDTPKTEGWAKKGALLSEVIGKEAAEQVIIQDAAEPGMEQVTKSFDVSDMVFGGDAMRNFYDEDVANEFRRAGRKLSKAAQIKKYGGTVMTEREAPYTVAERIEGNSGNRRLKYYLVGQDNKDKSWLGFDSREEADAKVAELHGKTEPVHMMYVTEAMKEAAMNGQTYFQGKRGAITFDEMRQGVIKMTESKNLSTFIHEAGHLYLEVFRTLAEEPGATQQIKDDYAKILAYLGVADSSQITRKEHELFAKSFERYAMAGKAPSLEMQDAFSNFRVWLLSIYRNIRSMVGAPLPEEITGVFDRMLASDEQIRESEAVQEYAAVFVDAEMAGMTPEQFAVYNRSHQRAHNDAVDKQTALALAEIRKADAEWRKDERLKVEAEVREEAYAMKVYQAIAFLQTGNNPDGTARLPDNFKLDKESTLEALRGDKTMLAKLPKPWVYTVKGGVHVDVAAKALGYKTGFELLDAMLTANPKVENYIQAETNARMKERYPDASLDGSLNVEAMRTVHTARRAEVIAFEMRKLRALAKADRAIVQATKKAAAREQKQAREANEGILPKRVELAAIKLAAKITIGRMKIRNVRPQEYLRAERKAGRLAFAAAARGDYQQAYVLKLQQLKNHELYRAAIAAKAQSESSQKYLARFESSTVQKRLGRSDLLNEILAIIEGIELRRKSLAQVDRDNAMRSLRQAIEDGRMIVTPGTLAKIMDDNINWQELTVEEFAEMRDMVKQLEHMAKKEVEAIVNGEKVLLEDARLDVAGSLYDNNKIIDVGTGKPTKGEQSGRAWKQGVHAWLRTSSIGRILDDSAFGKITRRIVVPMRRAYAERLIPWLHTAQSDTSEIYKKHFTASEMGKLNKKVIHIDAQNETYSKADLISMALNMGNEGNKKAVFAGVKRDGQQAYTEQGVRQMLSHLTANDWAFVQDVWDYYDTYWDDVTDSKGKVIREGLATTERRRRGVAPKKVENVPFQIRTSDGQTITVRGGYHPLAYDHRHSDRSKQNDMDDIYKKMQNGVFLTTSTRAGATYDRMENHGMVVRLDLNLIDSHLREIIRDLAIGDEVTYIKKILNSKDVRDAFNRTGNEVALDTLNLWLTDAAVGELPAEGFVENAASFIRTGFTKSRLGWNAMVVLLQFTGIAQTMATLGSAQYARGLGMYMRNPRAATREALARSDFLHTRYVVGTWDKDVQDTKAHLDSFLGPAPTRLKTGMNKAAYTYFLPIMKAQQVVDVSTWMAAYEKGINDPTMSDADAVLYADSIVEAAQTSGFFSDRSGLERGTLGARKNRQSQYIRLWTTLVSYMLAKGNIAYEKTQHLKKNENYKKPSEIAGYLGDMALLFTVEGILSALLYGRGPEEDPETEETNYPMWAARMTVESIVSGIPFVREIPAAMYGSGNTPIGAFAGDLWDLGVQLEQAEADSAMRKAFVTASGTAFHIPSTQINRFIEAIWAEDEDDEFIWTELATGKRKRDDE